MAYRLWETVDLKKPTMLITQRVERVPMVATCSSCPDVTFHIEKIAGSAEDNERALRTLFDHHFEVIHMREDASQAAARVVREATEGH